MEKQKNCYIATAAAKEGIPLQEYWDKWILYRSCDRAKEVTKSLYYKGRKYFQYYRGECIFYDMFELPKGLYHEPTEDNGRYHFDERYKYTKLELKVDEFTGQIDVSLSCLDQYTSPHDKENEPVQYAKAESLDTIEQVEAFLAVYGLKIEHTKDETN